MKKFKYMIILFVLMLGLSIPVNAESYETGVLIPLDTNASVVTDTFQYDFVAESAINEKGYSKLTFSNIKNLTDEKAFVSVNVLLFDSESKNIGMVTYCSDLDNDTEYTDFMLNGGASTQFYINVVPRYFAKNKTAADIKYVAVLDDNKYCHIGGYDQYEGLTIEKINLYHDDNTLKNLSILKNGIFMIVMIAIFIGLGLCFIQGLIVNTLHRKIYNCGNIFAFLPITNYYVSVKVAFGSMVAKIYIIGLIISVLLSSVLPVVSVLVGLVGFASIIVTIIKLVTKNYNLFTGAEANATSGKKVVEKKEVKTPVEKPSPAPAPAVPTVEEVIAQNKEEALDLSYLNGPAFTTQSNVPETTSESSSELGSMFNGTSNTSDKFVDINPPTTSSSDSTDNNFINFNAGNDNNQSNDTNNKDGESELSKFFQ